MADQNPADDFGFVPDPTPEPSGSPTPSGSPAPAATPDDDLGFVPDPTPAPKPDTSAMRAHVEENLKNYAAANADKGPVESNGQARQQNAAKSFYEALKAGLQLSTAGLGIRGELPDTVLPQDAPRAFRIASQIGTLAGDIPAMLIGGIIGGAASGAEGATIGSVVPGLGTAIGGVSAGAVGASAGAFAFPAALRKIMMDHYEKRDITSASDFTDRLLGTTWEAIKGATTGAATALTGGAIGAVAGPIAGLGSEIATMTTVGKVLDGHLPDAQDFIDAAIVVGGLHGVTMVAPKLRAIYAQTGEKPIDIINAAQRNPVLKQELASDNPDLPAQAKVEDATNPTTEVKLNSNHENVQPLLPGMDVPKTATVPHLDQWGNPVPGKVDLMSAGVAHRLPDVPHEQVTLKNGDVITLKAEMVSGSEEGEFSDKSSFGTKLAPLPGVAAYDASGRKIGQVPIAGEFKGEDRQFVHTSAGTEVIPEMRRNGVASAMYDYANRNITPLEPSEGQTEDGKAFSQEYTKRSQENSKDQTSDEEQGPSPIEDRNAKIEDSIENSPDGRTKDDPILSKIVAHPEKKTDGFTLEGLRTAVLDDLNPLLQATKSATGRSLEDEIALATQDNPNIGSDEKLAAGSDPYKLGTNFRSVGDKVGAFLSRGTLDFKTGKMNGEGLQTILEDTPDKDINGLVKYMVSKRALELADRGIETPFERSDLEAAVKEGAKFDDVAQRITDYRNRIKQYMVDAGMLDPKKSELFDEMNKSYVPFQYLMDEDPFTGQSSSPGSGFFRKIKGSGDREALLNPLQTIFTDTAWMITRAEENRVLQATVDLSNSSEFAEKVPGEVKPVSIGRNQIAAELEKQGIDTTDMNIDSITAFTKIDRPLASNERVIYRDGKAEVWAFRKDIYGALSALAGEGPKVVNVWAKLALAPFTITAKTLRAGVVLNPGFTLRHFERSQVMAAISSDHISRPFEGLLSSIGDIVGDRDAWNEMLNSGAVNGSMERVAKIMDEKPWELNKETGWLNNGWNTLKNKLDILGALQKISEVSDNAARLTEFKKSGGADENATFDQHTQAAFNARQVTIDNQRAGTLMRYFAKVVPFSNVIVQGGARMAENFTEHPLKYTANAAAFITIPSILTFLNGHKDERYTNAEDWEKDLFYVIPTNKWESPDSAGDLASRSDQGRRQLADGSWQVNNGYTYRIPKPFELGVAFGSIPERLLAHYVDQKPEAFNHLAATLEHGFVPNISPPLVTAAIEHTTNRSLFTGDAIISSQAEKLQPAYQQSNYTSETAKQIGKIIGGIPIVRGLGPKDAPLASPEIIDNYIQDLSGSLGKYSVQLADKGLHMAGVGNLTPKPETTINEIPFVKEFLIRNPTMKVQSIQDFKDNFDEASKLFATTQYLAKGGNLKASQALWDSEPELHMKLDGIQEAINTSRQVIQMTYANRNMTPTDKRQLINFYTWAAISASQRGNKMVSDFKKSVNNKPQTEAGQ